VRHEKREELRDKAREEKQDSTPAKSQQQQSFAITPMTVAYDICSYGGTVAAHESRD